MTISMPRSATSPTSNKAQGDPVTRPGCNPYDNDAAPTSWGGRSAICVARADIQAVLIYVSASGRMHLPSWWRRWATDSTGRTGPARGLIARKLIDRITSAVERKADHKAEFDKYLKRLQDDINPSVDAAQAIEMLAQYIITRPVFDAPVCRPSVCGEQQRQQQHAAHD